MIQGQEAVHSGEQLNGAGGAPATDLHAPGTPARRGGLQRVAVAAGTWLSLGLLGGIFYLLVQPQLDKPYVYDDVNFALAARAVAETGLPYGNQGHMSERWDFSQREQWALWHPPLYIYLLGLQVKLFGSAEAATRVLGVTCALMTALLVYLAGRLVSSGRQVACEATGVLAAAFYLLSPLELQSALILDIDGTILTLQLVLMVYLLLRFPPERHPRMLPVLAGLFALMLWTKMTTPLGLLGCLVVYHLLGGHVRQALRELLVIGVGGGLMFLASWGLVAWRVGMPFDMPFEVTWIQLVHASGTSSGWLRSPLAAAQTLAPGLLWAGLYLVPLFAAAALVRARALLVTRKPRPAHLLISFGVLVYLVYLIKLAGGFPKYHVAMLPFWALAAALLVVEVVGRLRLAEMLVLAAGAALFGRYFSTVPPELWVYGYQPELEYPLVTMPAALATVLVAALYLANGSSLGRNGALASSVMALTWGLAVGWNMAQTSHSTAYFYGTHGQREAAAVLDAVLRPEEFYTAAKEVAWYAQNQRYIDQDTLEHFVTQAGNRFDGQLVGYDIRVLALWVRPDVRKDLYREALSPLYDLAEERGDYWIWIRR